MMLFYATVLEKMSERQLHWGVLGCGSIAGDMVEAIKLLPPTEHKIVALGSRSIERCKEFQSKHNLLDATVYGSYEEFIQDPNIDVVYVASRNNQHLENTLMVLKARKNCLCEKPLGLNANEVKQIIACAKENNVFMQEAFWSRFFPIYKEIRKCIDEGRIGDVQLLNASFGIPIMNFERIRNASLGGGVALDLGGYLVQLALFVFGAATPVQSITAVGWKFGEVEDTASVTIKFEGNKMAQLLFSGTVQLKNSIDIYGLNGHIHVPKHMHSPDECFVTVSSADGKQHTEHIVREHPPADESKFFFQCSNGLAYEAAGVRQNILKGAKESIEITLAESRRVAEILDEIRRQLGV